ncbi:MAG TPA: VOC family protein [Rhizomicrobium sp.]
MSVSNLAYVGLAVADVEAWTRFAVDIVGMQDAGCGTAGERWLRLDARPCRLALHGDASDDLAYAGFEAPDETSIAALAAALRRQDVAVRALTAAEADRRNAQGGIAVRDPDGLAIKIVHGLRDASTPFRSATGAAFVTGTQGLGHMVVSTSNVARSLDFYSALGFKVSDYIETSLGPGVEVNLVFLHCNARHHTLALLPLPTPKRLNHLMFEVAAVDSVLGAYYRAQRNGSPIVRHMGRHTNDRMLSFYARTPAGFDVEYGCDPIHVGAGWTVRTYDAISLWGHEA